MQAKARRALIPSGIFCLVKANGGIKRKWEKSLLFSPLCGVIKKYLQPFWLALFSGNYFSFRQGMYDKEEEGRVSDFIWGWILWGQIP